MNSRYKLFLGIICLIYSSRVVAQKKHFSLFSPDAKTEVKITAGQTLSYSVTHNQKQVLLPSKLAILLSDGKIIGEDNTVVKTSRRNVNQNVQPLYGMASNYRDAYNEIIIKFKENYDIVFRVFDNGVAYRFRTSLPGRIKVKEEQINYQLTADADAWIQTTNSFQFSYEEQFFKKKISSLIGKPIASLPFVTESNGIKVAITESDLLDYPGYYLTYAGNNTLKGISPKFILKDTIGGQDNFNKLSLLDADYIAETEGIRDFPWRLMILEENDKDLLYNNLVYLLASENKIEDTSWIKPGKVSWDWWNANNLTGVDFKSGFNTATYKYFIDFAAENKLEYIMMDEGWSDQFDLLKVNDGSVVTSGTTALSGTLDMPYLFNYAKQKGVGIILWCVWHTLDRQMIEALDQFQKWGVKGVKVDFMNRDDQTVVCFYERLAKETAKRKMIIDFHAAYKPTGLERTYPNILNFEAVQGLEWNKFSEVDILTQATILPFTRMLAGPMDYTPGGLYNSNLIDYRKSFFRPMTLGTRCNQLAMFTMYYAPFEMLADAPTAYQKEPEILAYLAAMPNTWDDTIPLEGKIGDHAVIARRKGSTWHIAGLNNWTGKNVKIKFDFLDAGDYQATIFSDGINANRIGSDYKKTTQKIDKASSLEIQMANGGGFAIKLEKIK
ncbi:glycoside hydrolase family 97 protein [Pedobacter frigiditerrae]|uniref:Glycoside hydrolase family 97 protein n=1 Tax=Pedobacter frigiditerrae TaxID=2530452 RepID=A0A4V2MI23_9SPHI|nr:glycoside hydrolase family 97 protein [Pedobacter frigiditerrae]TCC88766.1 glycoside hydrolase family 97 protein [Pedobacter frigiditerrae]